MKNTIPYSLGILILFGSIAFGEVKVIPFPPFPEPDIPAEEASEICNGLSQFNGIEDNLIEDFRRNFSTDCFFKLPVEMLEGAWGIPVIDANQDNYLKTLQSLIEESSNYIITKEKTSKGHKYQIVLPFSHINLLHRLGLELTPDSKLKYTDDNKPISNEINQLQICWPLVNYESGFAELLPSDESRLFCNEQ